MTRKTASPRARAAALGLGLGLLAAAAQAQKTADTLKVAVSEPIRSLVQVEDPRPESELFTTAVFDGLICYDKATHGFKPSLAESWTRVDPKTLVFKLRRDVKWHDGTPFSADDVVYTLRYYQDPASKLYLAASEISWLDSVEKIDDHTVRVVQKGPTPLALQYFAWNAQMLPKSHGSYANKSDFGRKAPIGTGPYKVVSMDTNKGVVLVRNDAYFGKPGGCRGPAKIKNVQAVPIGDAQTQVAQLMTGGIQLMTGGSKDEIEMLTASPAVKATVNVELGFFFMNFDSAGRSAQKALADVRVRRAVIQAIDRDELARSVIAGGAAVKPLDAFCPEASVGCWHTKRPPKFDPAAARALLAEAGFAKGLDVEISAVPGTGRIAEAIAGQLRKVGIRATVLNLPFSVYRQNQVEGKLQIAISHQGQPDASSPSQLLLSGGPRDYAQDKEITALVVKSQATDDEAERKIVNTQLLDAITEKSYILPLTSRPDIFLHDAGLVLPPSQVGRITTSLDGMSWR